MEVGTVFVPTPVVLGKERVLFRLICRPPVAAVGTVITIGDQVGPAAAAAPEPVVSEIVIVGAAV
jgi:hypothetical protein